jgi:hypothetical protein
MRGTPRLFIAAALSLGVIAAAAVLYAFTPEGHGFYPRCPLYVLTGLQCAGCGTLRALHSLLHGDLAQAVAFNPILVFSIPLLLLLSVKPRLAYKRSIGWSVFAIVVIYTVWRNLGK